MWRRGRRKVGEKKNVRGRKEVYTNCVVHGVSNKNMEQSLLSAELKLKVNRRFILIEKL